jgi:hypothetical protein
MIVDILVGGLGILANFFYGMPLESHRKNELCHWGQMAYLRPQVLIHFCPDDRLIDIVRRGCLSLQVAERFPLDSGTALVIEKKGMGRSPQIRRHLGKAPETLPGKPNFEEGIVYQIFAVLLVCREPVGVFVEGIMVQLVDLLKAQWIPFIPPLYNSMLRTFVQKDQVFVCCPSICLIKGNSFTI